MAQGNFDFMKSILIVVWNNLLGHCPRGESEAEARSELNTINSATKCNGMSPPSAFTYCCRESVQSIIHSASVRCHGRDSARTTSRKGLRRIRCSLPTAQKMRRFRAITFARSHLEFGRPALRKVRHLLGAKRIKLDALILRDQS